MREPVSHRDVRAHHPAWMVDPKGFLAMAADELLIHGDDVATGLGVVLTPPDRLVARVRGRPPDNEEVAHCER